MKRLVIVLLAATLMLPFANCKKDNNDNDGGGNLGGGLTDRQKLTSKSWTSYKILNSGTDVTGASSSVTFNFNDNGTYTAGGVSGSGSDNWSLSGSTLDLGSEGVWTVKTLTNTELEIDYSNGAVVIYFR